MDKYIWALLCLSFMVACGNNKDIKEITDVIFEGDTITVTENSPILEQIIIKKAQLQDFEAEFRTVGTVRPVAGKLAEIAPPFAGRIVKSHIKLGQNVSTGSPIFELSSSEFYEATKSYFAALSENELAQRNYNRQKDLAANGVASQRELEEAQSDANIAQREYEMATANLRIFDISVETWRAAPHSQQPLENVETWRAASLQVGQPLHVVSPIAGEVIKYDITIGGYVREDAEPLAVVADLSTVWVDALVKEKYFGAIKQGDRVEIYTDALPGKIIWGTIYYIGEMLDEETRSLDVIVACDNTDRQLKLGMFCEAHFLSAPTKAIVLPATAVMQEQESDYVLVETAKGRYIRRKVVTESVHRNEVRIVSGIAEGESVIVEGGVFLQ
jgi:cobalt-zinc-cadmium efflux system membrane fusion protein